MNTDEQRRRAESLLAQHNAPPILVLPNAWDAATARLYELEGFTAIGTTSGGIAAAFGYPDGQRISLNEMADAVRRIVACVDIPVSGDMEAGYATSPDGVADSARTFLEAGAVGINLEDGSCDASAPLLDESLQVEKIRAIREAAVSAGIPLVINARTDVYICADEDPATRLRHAVKRANAYRVAGADCIFVPDVGALDRETIARLVNEIDAPINVIAGDTTPSLSELEEIGVARVSFGPRPMRAALALVRKIARQWRQSGTYGAMLADTVSYAEVNAMFERKCDDNRGSDEG
jgi:2-methylisocitrate lyase-like PEP mutase family enzyme